MKYVLYYDYQTLPLCLDKIECTLSSPHKFSALLNCHYKFQYYVFVCYDYVTTKQIFQISNRIEIGNWKCDFNYNILYI